MSVESTTTDTSRTVRCAIYARSASTQDAAYQILDQELNCRAAAAQQPGNWVVLDDFVRSDVGVSGLTFSGREGLRSLLTEARSQTRPFDCLLVDNTARLSRNPVNVLHLIDSLAYYGVQVYFASQRLSSEDAPFEFFF